MDPEALYVQLGRLIESMPDLTVYPQAATATQWLARGYALTAVISIVDAASIKDAMGWLASPDQSREVKQAYAQTVAQSLHRALAVAELSAPATAQGAFIPAGNAFDGFAAVGKVLSSGKGRLLIVDPYLDEKVLTDFAPLAVEGVTIWLLADQQSVKPSLQPAVARWSAQYGAKRPIEAKLAAPRALHDRLIIVDGQEAWDLTQSLNAFAARAPASIVRSGPEQAALKIPYYEGTWASAAAI
jgi:hypothetical protein